MKEVPSFLEFEKFSDELACIDFLEKVRFPDGNIVSPFGDRGASRVSKGRPGVYKCRETRKTFTVRNGTIFEESRLPLHTWFYAIHLICSQKNGVSSVQIAKFCDVTQKTAWFMLYRIRYAVEHGDFKRPLDPLMDIDEHFGTESTKDCKRGCEAEPRIS